MTYSNSKWNSLSVILIIIVTIILSTAGYSEGSLWRDRNIYSSAGSLNPGDIIIVKIEDISKMKFTLTVNSKSSFSISSKPDKNITSFLPDVNSEKKTSNSETADFAEQGSMNISIAARIKKKLDDGKFSISGSKGYSVNGIRNIIVIGGIIDPKLVKGKIVNSSDIADFRLDIKGVKLGVLGSIKRDKLKKDEKASTELNEDEKQKIIIDYLNRMLMELTR